MMETRFVYGLSGLCELLHCSHSTAYKFKSSVLSGTYAQIGRKIVFDVDKVLLKLGLTA